MVVKGYYPERLIKALFFLLTVSVCQVQAWAAGRPSASLSSPRTDWIIGDAIEVVVSIETNTLKPVSMEWPERLILPRGLEMRDTFSLDSSRRKDKSWQYRKHYFIMGFDSGAFTLPPQTVTLNGQTLQTDSLRLKLNRITVNREKDIKDIRPIFEVGYPWLSLWPYALAVLALLLGGWLLWRYYRRPAPYPHPRPTSEEAYRRAMAALQALEEEQLPQRGEWKEYYTRLSLILRHYTGQLYNINTLEITSSELLRAVRRYLPHLMEPRLANVLRRADLAKFARYKAGEQKAQRDMEDARLLVNELRPKSMHTQPKAGR